MPFPRLLLAFIIPAFTLPAMTHGQTHSGTSRGMHIPSSVEAEHQQLHRELDAVLRLGGQTARAAADVEKLLAPHFVKEEQIALPPLGALQALSKGEDVADAPAMITLTEKLKSGLPQMLQEHEQIKLALARLHQVARAEQKPQAMQFASGLMAHARQEEEILYPAAILVGEILKSRQKD